ncbi:MAG: bifunctional riboflavin kinase/FAD synthetase [Chitinophagaceae bacterium]|nr:bifunctional riboflavin kinase/FAD synthetase [Chitinophagaceae bacterium]
MKVFSGIDDLPRFERPVLTIGTFDGVHHGHRTILDSVVREAKAMQGTSILITFAPHPRKLICPDEALHLLNTLEERLDQVARSGMDVTIVVPFTKAFAQLTAQEYIERFLIGKFHPVAIVIGYDHRFGHDRTGGIGMLQEYSKPHHFLVREIPPQLIDQAAVSSTQIRKALLQGQVEQAAQMLDSYYSLSGTVNKGAQRGRTIGFPTANITVPDPDKLVPLSGVYAVYVLAGGQRYKGMLNIGTNPTVTADRSIKIEVHLLDFDGDLYDQQISIQFVKRLRSEQKFEGLDALKAQLAADRQHTEQALAPPSL